MADAIRYRVISDERVGQGGFLSIRRLRLRLEHPDGSVSAEGLYDFVERPTGLDAIVLALWRNKDDRVEVLLREGLRVPLAFGRTNEPFPRRIVECVAGIIEAGEETTKDLKARAAAEALEEAGFRTEPSAIEFLGPAMYPTPGMCAEKFFFAACEVPVDAVFEEPMGDGSPFEEGARLLWIDLDDALAKCARGEFDDMKTELLLRRLKDHLQDHLAKR